MDFSIVNPTRCTISQIYFILETTLYMFRMVSSSIIRSLRVYIQHQVYVIQVLWLLISALASSHGTCKVWCCMYSLRLLVMDEETVRPCILLFQNKINLRYCAFGWVYYRNILRCTVRQTSKNEFFFENRLHWQFEVKKILQTAVSDYTFIYVQIKH